MKTKKMKLRILAILAATVLGTASCTKILNQEPKNSTYSEKFWQTGRDARYALAGNYSLLRSALSTGWRYNMYGDGLAKAYYVIDYEGDGLEGIQGGDFTFQYNVNTYGNWADFFKVITMSNEIIARIPKMTDAMVSDDDEGDSDPVKFRNKLVGQALFIRAYTYFTMTRIWGDVPLVLEAYADPITAPQLPRTPKAEVLAQIIKDAQEAASLMRWGYDSYTVGAGPVMANKGAAYALLAHAYLWRATTANLSTVNLADVHSADTTIAQVMAYGGYSHTDTSGANYYRTFIGKSSEGIFEIAMAEDQLEGSNNSIGMKFLRNDYLAGKGAANRMAVQPSYFESHYPDSLMPDVRYTKNFDFWDNPRPMCRKFSNVIYRRPGKKEDPYLSNNMIIFRLTDLELLRAEIAIYEGRLHDAYDVINVVRKRNGAPEYPDLNYTKSQMIEYYINERGRELYLEGHNFYDIVRTGATHIVDWLTAQRRLQEGFYWPVDPRLFRGNPFLLQTSFWRGRV
ncbi:RagB/SusD family nutrient uptake outer membrane protein [uncultured Chitinophaga sp.]|uniref:RagB/SusD family nutrient uptake outer membrane protein n=1 Tax=uncultured Chitinophaga sp. TaxID=339340 RepID=UPI0025F48FB9|nr:RagB/SusD family nutrient uptake outer membrane protein [uncultured Chitinophaga sp.]